MSCHRGICRGQSLSAIQGLFLLTPVFQWCYLQAPQTAENTAERGGGEAPFINSLFILNLLISCCFCSLTKRSRDTGAFYPSARGERGREWVWEGKDRERDERSDMISNSAETAIDRRERESVSHYLAAGMFSCSCVLLGKAAALQNTPPRIRCTTKASVMSAFVYRGMFLLISCVFNSAFQSCRPGLNCIPWRYHTSNPDS